MDGEQTISQIVAEVASALKDAATEYGPQAADLALLAYRVDAIKSLLFIPVGAAVIYGAWRGWNWLWAASETWCDPPEARYRDTTTRDVPRVIAGILGGLGSAIVAGAIVARAIDVPLWMAAFGRPELLIATRALQSAGLL